jgi:hypothetical protein
MAGFNRSKYEAWGGYTWTYTGLVFAGRFGYHPDLGVKNLDAYANISLGYYMFTAKASDGPNPSALSTFYWGGNLGARYFFKPAIGAYVELGYSSFSFVSAGVTVKF